MLTFAAACGGGGSSGGSGSGDAVRYGFDFELNLSDTFDPQQSLSTCDRLALEWIYGTLTTLDESGAPQPGLAESWEVDDDAGTMTLTLRDGLEFSDGTPFDAEAVAAGLEYLKTGEQVSEGLTAMASAEALDATTVQITLDGPGFSLPYNLAGREGMIPAPSTYDIDDPEAGTADTDPIGAGPFRFVEFSPGERIVLERNEGYGGPESYDFDTLQLTQVGVGNPAVTALAAGELDVIGYEAESQSVIDDDSSLSSNSRLGEVYAQLQLRLDEPFDDVRIRQALNYAVDREEYIEVVQNGVGEVAWMPYPEASPNFNPEAAGVYEHDPERARELLAEAGVPDGFEFDMAIPGGVTGQERQGELLQAQLAEVGITANIVPLGTDIATEYYLQRGADAFSAARPASPNPVGQVNDQWAEFAFVAIHNDAERPDLTDLVRQAEAAATDEERAELMQQAMAIIVEDALEVPIAFTPRNVAWSNERIEGEIGAPAEICDPVDLQGVSLRLRARAVDPMGAYIARRLLGLIPLLLLISFAVFALVLAVPGDPARTIAGGLDASEDRVEEIREELGLDDPVVEQYLRWLGDVVSGDLGTSLFNGRTVASELAARFPVTLSLALGAVVFAAAVGIPLGILAGTRPGSLLDRALSIGTSLGIALPDFFLATAMVVLFAVNRDLLPAIGYVDIAENPVEWAEHLIMPWIALGVASAASLARQVRGSMIEVLDADYIRTARAKGLGERRVLGRHALKNALTPAMTVLGLQFAYLLGGTFIIESIFALPGIGTYMLAAITSRDLPVIQGVVLLVAVLFVFTNLLVDILYGVLNPKVRVT